MMCLYLMLFPYLVLHPILCCTPILTLPHDHLALLHNPLHAHTSTYVLHIDLSPDSIPFHHKYYSIHHIKKPSMCRGLISLSHQLTLTLLFHNKYMYHSLTSSSSPLQTLTDSPSLIHKLTHINPILLHSKSHGSETRSIRHLVNWGALFP